MVLESFWGQECSTPPARIQKDFQPMFEDPGRSKISLCTVKISPAFQLASVSSKRKEGMLTTDKVPGKDVQQPKKDGRSRRVGWFGWLVSRTLEPKGPIAVPLPNQKVWIEGGGASRDAPQTYLFFINNFC